MKEVNIFTDGSCVRNPGPGGWSAVLVENGKSITGNDAFTTNNRMEMTAVIEALFWIEKNAEKYEVDVVYIHSDSSYVINALTKGWLPSWKKRRWLKSSGEKVMNKDLWEKIDVALGSAKKHAKVKFCKVKGHSGEEWNEKADALAKEAARCMM